VLCDDLTVEQAQTLFGQLRDEWWQTPVRFMAAVRPDVAQALSAPPADVFFDDRLTLDPLAGADASRLLERRHAAGDAPRVAELDPHGARQPRALVALAEDEGSGGRDDPGRHRELLAVAGERAGRPGATLLGEMWGRAGVSASDAELQRRLGVTRNRLTALLRTLADAGVLSSYPEPREGKTGRPRMIYTVADQ
jgi:hypothetical protein